MDAVPNRVSGDARGSSKSPPFHCLIITMRPLSALLSGSCEPPEERGARRSSGEEEGLSSPARFLGGLLFAVHKPRPGRYILLSSCPIAASHSRVVTVIIGMPLIAQTHCQSQHFPRGRKPTAGAERAKYAAWADSKIKHARERR